MADGDKESFPHEINSDTSRIFSTDYNAIEDMKVPETITVRNNLDFSENKSSFGDNQTMHVPDRIFLNGAPSGVETRSINLENSGVITDKYAGDMDTPPRTLTVDDTKSRYIDRNSEKMKRHEDYDR